MADYRKAIPHVLRWEGGLSSDPKDTAAQGAVTSKLLKGYPIHTNRGVTYTTWLNTADKVGNPKTEQAFLNMTDGQWGKIFKKQFWDIIQADRIKSQAIAELLVEFAWGSGFGGAKIEYRALQKYLTERGYDTKGIDGAIGRNTIRALNEYINKTGAKGEKELYDFLWLTRRNSLAKKRTASIHYKGWMNRMNAHLNIWKDTLGKILTDNPAATGIITSIFFILGGLFFLGKRLKK